MNHIDSLAGTLDARAANPAPGTAAPAPRAIAAVAERLASLAATGRGFALLAGLICLLGLALRLPMLGAASLWIDEAYSAWFSSESLHALWTEVPLYETHPPLFYTLLKGWSALFGTSEAGLRSLSVTASVATILLVALAGRILRSGAVGDRVALIAALLLAVNQGSIHHAQDARVYALEALVATAAILSALVLLQAIRTPDRPLLPGMLALGLTGGLTLWMHNTGLFIAFGIWSGLAAATLLARPARPAAGIAAIGGAGLIALLLWSPFLPLFLAQSRNVNAMTFWIEPKISDLWSAWALIAGGPMALAPVAVAGLLGLRWISRADRPSAVLVAVILFLPLSLVLTISFAVKPVYIDRLFEWLAPLAAAVVGLWLVRGNELAREIRIGIGAVIVVLNLGAAVSHYGAPTENWRGLVDTIARNARAGDVVILSPNEVEPAIRYYAARLPSFLATVSVPGAFPYRAPDRRYVTNLAAPRIETADRERVQAAMRGRQRVWLVERKARYFDPDGVVAATILESFKRVGFDRDGDLELTLFE